MATPQVGFTLESFASTVAQFLEHAPADVIGIFAVDDGDDVLCMPLPEVDTKASEMVNRLAVGRRFLGLATRTMFATDWDARSYLAWVATCVEADRPAWFMVKQDREELWGAAEPPGVPAAMVPAGDGWLDAQEPADRQAHHAQERHRRKPVSHPAAAASPTHRREGDAVTATFCCPMMGIQVNWYCTQHADAYSCPDALISLSEQHGYGIRIHDGGDSFLKIDFCPWCGQRLDRG